MRKESIGEQLKVNLIGFEKPLPYRFQVDNQLFV